MIYALIYIVGFILTLTFLKLFGKKLGIDYDPPHEDWYDDYDNNAQAYLFFSLSWVVTAPMFLIAGTFQLLYKFSQWFLKYPNV
jgi:ABC-type dipeptide/oligopeptide/nickel transport system permease subunit